MYIIFLVIILVLVIVLYFRVYLQKESLKISNESHIVIGGIVYNCEKHLDKVFENIKEILTRFISFHIIVYIDMGTDNSLKLLQKYKSLLTHMTILEGKKTSKIRTKNICIARNKVIDEVLKMHKKQPYNYFIIMDMDDVCSSKINMQVFDEAMQRSNEWDSISFNKDPYYDIWALSYDPFLISVFHWEYNAVQQLKKLFTEKLKNWPKEKLFPVYSAFGGFAIYKTDPFAYLKYQWHLDSTMPFLTSKMKKLNEEAMLPNKFVGTKNQEMDCEHRYFHFCASFIHNAKIQIMPKILFP
jgi:hypothetical protein